MGKIQEGKAGLNKRTAQERRFSFAVINVTALTGVLPIWIDVRVAK